MSINNKEKRGERGEIKPNWRLTLKSGRVTSPQSRFAFSLSCLGIRPILAAFSCGKQSRSLHRCVPKTYAFDVNLLCNIEHLRALIDWVEQRL